MGEGVSDMFDNKRYHLIHVFVDKKEFWVVFDSRDVKSVRDEHGNNWEFLNESDAVAFMQQLEGGTEE
jgi:hypothetical protein